VSRVEQRPPRIVMALVEGALRAYPRVFRDRFGAGMLDAFEARWRERRHLGGMALTATLLRAMANLMVTGVAERVRPRHRPEEVQRPRMTGWLGMIAQDLGFGARLLRKQLGFTSVAVVTLALGIGANSAIFSVVDGVLLNPLPYHDPHEIIYLTTVWGGAQSGSGVMSYPDLVDIEHEVPAIETLVGYNTASMTLTGVGEPVVETVARVTEGLLQVFEVAPFLGRDIRADEFGPDGPRVAVISYGMWHDRFGGDPGVIGRMLELNAVSFEIVGVAPDDFGFPVNSPIWIPRRLDPEECARGCHTMRGIGRLAAGASLETAQRQVQQLAERLEAAYRDTNYQKSFKVQTLQDQIVGDVKAGLWLMLGAVGLVLLIACANVANLLLVRSQARATERAVRAALGATRPRLIAQSLVESGLLALLGGAAGLGLAHLILKALPGLAGGQIPRLEDVAIDGQVLLFTAGTVFAVVLLFGLVPALSGSTLPGSIGLGRGAGDSGPRHQRFRSWLLAAEVALSTVLLIGAGLLLRTFYEMHEVHLGYQTENIVRFNINLPEVRYTSLDAVRNFYRGLEDEIRTIPGVASVGSAWSPPLASANASGIVYIEGRPEPPPEQERDATIHSVSPGWLQTMGITVRSGRSLRPEDDVGGDPVAVVNESFVKDNFPDEDPLGKSVRVTVDLGYGHPYFRIVGVIPDIRGGGVIRDPEPGIWVPHGQFGPEAMTVTVRTVPGATPVLPLIRAAVRSRDANLPLYNIETMDEAVARQIAPTRFYMILAAAFAGLAALLAAVGLYGVAAYAASRRTREIGVRVALGADRGGIIRLVLGQGIRPAAWGLIAGLTGAYFGAKLLEALLFGVAPRDPAIFAAVAVLLAGVAVFATVLPARRASKIDPVVALQAE
jgi:putative ABC transport system permease protein